MIHIRKLSYMSFFVKVPLLALIKPLKTLHKLHNLEVFFHGLKMAWM